MFPLPMTPQAPISTWSTQRFRRDSVTSEAAAQVSSSNMLRIPNLLNPEGPSQQADRMASRTPTPAYTANTANASTPTPTSTPVPETPLTPASTKRPKVYNVNGVIFQRGPTQGVVKYKPTEKGTDSPELTDAERAEMVFQHEAFQTQPEGPLVPGLIEEYPKHIPYASEKKGFFANTGREAFEIFQYVFTVPDDPEQRTYTVMWDYQIGLVRITPFFKACGLSKTIPAKALGNNPGLKDLCHSITGGALQAQGYWVPFDCARAVCLTFCYPIRWVLTPLFGHSFITECLKPNESGFGRYKIDPELVRRAHLVAESWKQQASRSATPASSAPYGYPSNEIPRSVPPPTSVPSAAPRVKRERPTFMSPFDSDREQTYRPKPSREPAIKEEPSVSPKSSPVEAYPPAFGGWTSINQRASPTPPSPPRNAQTGYANNSMQLLTEPHEDHSNINSNSPQPSAWRSLDGHRSASPATRPQRQTRKPSARDSSGSLYEDEDEDDDDADAATSDSASTGTCSSSSSSDGKQTPCPPQTGSTKTRAGRKRARQSSSEEDEGVPAAAAASRPAKKKGKQSTLFMAEDARAAELLLELANGGKAYLR